MTISNNECAVLMVAEMNRADRLAAEAGVLGLDLMEMAGRAVTGAILDRWPAGRAAVLCGPGNNGGDGFVVARLLVDAGWKVNLGLLGTAEVLSGDAATNAGRWKGNIQPLTSNIISECDVVVDALFGAGLSRPLDGVALEIARTVKESGIPVVAVDMPSGIDGDSGAVLNVALKAQLTVTFFRKKPGHLLYPGRAHCGQLLVADIGIPEGVLDEIAPELAENLPGLWVDSLPIASARDHKYSRGHLLISGGAEMTGATRLSARGARRVGAGMVTIAAPELATAVYRVGEPGILVSATNQDIKLDDLLERRQVTAALVGPGSGVGLQTRQNVIAALRAKIPAVIDADGLTSFEGAAGDLFGWINGPCVLTPHMGEFVRLFPDLEGGRLEQVRVAAGQSGAVVVLKGADTVIGAPDGRAVINANAPPGLATAGTGDVLAGMIGSLLAQGLEPMEAASAAGWLHGEAAQMFAALHGSSVGLIAEDLPDQLPSLLSGLANTPK
ncbi:MAG: NAD(P)H-hydrate dehydratase [Pseudomonadota bacterium]|nr:NAD(P)H-hydrate dehydratase [Pseudomonadota bacterium]